MRLMITTILLALTASAPSAFAGTAKSADKCACSKKCMSECKKGDHGKCDCKTCDCKKGHCSHDGKCDHDHGHEAKDVQKQEKSETKESTDKE